MNLVSELRECELQAIRHGVNFHVGPELLKQAANEIERLMKAVEWWKTQAIKLSGNETLAKQLGVFPP